MDSSAIGLIALLSLFCSGLGAVIVEERGGSAVTGFWVGLIFGPLGVLVAFFLGSDEGKARIALADGHLKKCPRCAELVQPDAQICKHCRHEFAPIAECDDFTATSL